MRLSHVDFTHNVQTSPSLAIFAAGDTVITHIEPFSLDRISHGGIRFRVTTASARSVLVALDPYHLHRPVGETPARDAAVDATSEYIRWTSAEPGRVYVGNGCVPDHDETGGGARIGACVDAWRYLKPDDPSWELHLVIRGKRGYR